jgi:hypothetical protein
MNTRNPLVLLSLALMPLCPMGCWRSTSTETTLPTPEAVDRFIAIVTSDQGLKLDTDTASQLAWQTFRVGTPAEHYEKAFSCAHEKIVTEKRIVYLWYPGRKAGQEGDVGIIVKVRGTPPTIHEAGAGIICH